MLRRPAIVVAAVLVLLVGGIGVAWLALLGDNRPPELRKSAVTVGPQRITVEVADNDAARSLGLGKRNRLPEGSGMLFVFDRPGDLCFWMKDMRFSIDMVWLDPSKRVVRVVENVAPATYPASFCAPPGQPARYVLEVGAGQAAANGLRAGVPVRF